MKPSTLPTAAYLKIDSGEAEKSGEYAKDDLWVVSTSAGLPFAAPVSGQVWGKKRHRSVHEDEEGGPERASALAHACVFRSVYHGPSSKGMIELTPALPWERWAHAFLCVVVCPVCVRVCGFERAWLCKCVPML